VSLGLEIEAERAAAQVRELTGVDGGAHESITGVRIGLQQVVSDLVRDGAAQDDPQPVFVNDWKIDQPGELCLIDNALRRTDRCDRDRRASLEP
jgi:hypothetical protein